MFSPKLEFIFSVWIDSSMAVKSFVSEVTGIRSGRFSWEWAEVANQREPGPENKIIRDYNEANKCDTTKFGKRLLLY